MNNLFYFLQAFLIIYISFLMGLKLIELFKFEFSEETNAFYAVVLGFGTLGLVGLVFSLFSLYKPTYFWLIFLLVFLISAKTVLLHLKQITFQSFYKDLFSNIKHWFREYTILKIIICVFVLVYFLLSFVPSFIASDALAYHLPYILKIIDDGRMSIPLKGAFTLEPNLSYGHLPILTELFYGIPILLFKNLVSFKIVQLLSLFILLHLIVNFISKRFKNKLSTLLLSTVLLACMPLVRLALEGGFIEMFTMLFGILSTILLVQMIVDGLPPKKTLLASAIFLGFAISTKYIGLFYGALNGFLLIYFFYKQKSSFKSSLKTLVWYALPPILIAGFWYIKNFVYMGNPVFPMLSVAYKDFSETVNLFVVEPHIWNFPLLPFSLFGQGMTFKLPFAFLTAVYFAGSYLMTLYLWFKEKLGRIEVIFLFLTEMYLLLMFYMTHQLRFAVPTLIFISILFVLEIDSIIDSTKKLERFYKPGVIVVSILLLGAGVYSLKTQLSCLVGRTDQTTCSKESTRSTFLIYQASEYINQNLRDTKVIEYRNAYDAFDLINGNVYVREDCGLLGGLAGKETMVKSCLKEKDISYLLDDTEARGQNKYPVTEYFYKNANIVFEKYDAERNTFMRLLKLR